MLTAGDQNPNLVLDIFWKKDRHLLLEGMLDEALVIGSSVDRRHKEAGRSAAYRVYQRDCAAQGSSRFGI